jgi:hypothetical protein
MNNSTIHFVCNLQNFEDINKFVNINKRADIKVDVTFQIGKDLPCLAPSSSISTLKDQIAEISNRIKQYQFAKDHEDIVETIKETILYGINKRTALVQRVYEGLGRYYRHTIYNVLDELEGNFWKVTKYPDRSKVYSII